MSKNKKDITIEDMFPKDHISGHDIGEGNAFVMEIVDYDEKKVFNPNQNKTKLVWTLRFKGARKPLILNVTNAEAVAKIADSRLVADWVGCKVELYAEWVKAFGANHLTVRIREPKDGVEDMELTRNGEGLSKEAQAYYDYSLGIVGHNEANSELFLSNFEGDYVAALKMLMDNKE